MKFPLVAALGFSIAASTAFAAESFQLKTSNDQLSYTIGVDLGNNFKRQHVELNADALGHGLRDSQKGNKLLLTDAEMQKTLKAFQKNLLDKRLAEFKDQAENNKQVGDTFLKENAKKDGVKQTTSGLQYKIIKAGTGQKPSVKDTVVVEYTGRLINGKVFDTTEGKGHPVSFKLNEVIPGWTEALQLMQEGSTWEIYLPPSLAYGSRGVGVGGPIGPNETLIFKITLLTVKPA